MLPNEYNLQKSTARKSPAPSNSTVPGTRTKRRTLRGSQAKAIERLSGIKKTPSKKLDSKIVVENKDSSFKSSAMSKSMDILAKNTNTRNTENKKVVDNESSVAQSYRSSNIFEKESSKGGTSSRMETASYK